MDRGQFLIGSGAVGLEARGAGRARAATVPGATHQAERMKRGDQTAPTTDAHLAYLVRYCVRNI